MSRKVLLSFLGTGNYMSCKYKSKEMGESKVVVYAQEAIADLYCREFTKNDIAYVFLTKAAEEKHWDDLNSVLVGKHQFKVKGVKNISEGYSEEQLWSIFETIYNVLEEDDEIILDVTHAFRSLPMLQIVLLNYAKSLKNVKINAILYGAFESIGPAYNIAERIPNPKDRVAALLDLTAFSAIQAWTFGAESFIKTGKTTTIKQLSLENIKPILIDSKGKDETANGIRGLMKSLSSIENSITTNRGKLINEGESFEQAKAEILKLSENTDTVFTPIKPILKQILSKLEVFDERPHWEAAVQWCIDHELIQQGITQLQEGIISFICEKHELDKYNLTDRELVAQALNILEQKFEEADWHTPAADYKEKVKEIINDEFAKEHKGNYAALSTYRNDINHGGYKENSISNGRQFKGNLEKIFKEFRYIRNEHFGSN